MIITSDVIVIRTWNLSAQGEADLRDAGAYKDRDLGWWAPSSKRARLDGLIDAKRMAGGQVGSPVHAGWVWRHVLTQDPCS